MKTRKIMAISASMLIASMVCSSAYLATRGSWKGTGFTFRAHHADIYNIRRESKTGKIRHYHWSRSSFRIVADTGYVISKKSSIVIKGTKKSFTGYGTAKKGYWDNVYSIDSRGHVVQVRLVVQVMEKSSGKVFRIDKKFRLQRDFSSRPTVRSRRGRLKITEI